MRSAAIRNAAFSLVEIILALGVISFAVVAIIGLLAVSLNTSRASASDTVMGAMTGSIVNGFRSQPFDSVAGGNFYFDADGISQPALQPDSIYECVVTVTDDTGTQTPTTGQINLKRVNLEFRWPAVTASPPNKQIINATVARH